MSRTKTENISVRQDPSINRCQLLQFSRNSILENTAPIFVFIFLFSGRLKMWYLLIAVRYPNNSFIRKVLIGALYI